MMRGGNKRIRLVAWWIAIVLSHSWRGPRLPLLLPSAAGATRRPLHSGMDEGS